MHPFDSHNVNPPTYLLDQGLTRMHVRSRRLRRHVAAVQSDGARTALRRLKWAFRNSLKLHWNWRRSRARSISGSGNVPQNKTLVAGGPVRIVLDLAQISYVDSAGIGELVSAYTSVTSQGGRLALAALQKRVIDLLQITKLLSVFEVFDSVDQATAALSVSTAN